MKRQEITLVVTYDENDSDSPSQWDWSALTDEQVDLKGYSEPVDAE